jgi:hypothetical protein
MSFTSVAQPAVADSESRHVAMTLSASEFSVPHTFPNEDSVAMNEHDSLPRHRFVSVRSVWFRSWWIILIALLLPPTSTSSSPHMPGLDEKNHSG